VPLIAESQRDFFLAGVTSYTKKTMGHDVTLQISVKLALHISGQVFGIGIVVERSEEAHVQGVRLNHTIFAPEERPARR
jgi:hypothetical protein